MSDAPGEAPKPPGRFAHLMERYGGAAVATILGLFALEMGVFTPLVKYGVDLSPLLDWIGRTFGWELERDPTAGNSWLFSLAIAYAITRPLKPIQIAIAVVLTPIVAQLPWFRHLTDDDEAPTPEG
ncbi:MAG: DUF1279 domain-containing protein [Alphaproteobacteria bacterium]|nr:DUF1279 domain-containing protein [Alphaproteobacteria bacterium]